MEFSPSQKFLQEILNFHFANDLPQDDKFIPELTEYFGIGEDFQVVFLGIFHDFYRDKDSRYFDRGVAHEFFSVLKVLSDQTPEQFRRGFFEGLPDFFLGLESYFLTREKRVEIRRVDLDPELKNVLYRIPTYASICESVLMNFYRFIAKILTNVVGKDYSTQETLGKIVPVLQKYGLTLSTNINVDLRNAINHGTVFPGDGELEFKFSSNGEKKYLKTSTFEFDQKIDSLFDIASALIVGFVRLVARMPLLLVGVFESISSSPHREYWFRVLFHSLQTHCADVDLDRSPGQVTVRVRTSIMEEGKLLVSIRSLLNGLIAFFPDQESYCIIYNHPRSLGGIIRMSQQDLLKFLSYSGSGEAPVLSKDIVYLEHPIQHADVDVRKHKYFMFPELEDDDWYIEATRNISLESLKRFKMRLILKRTLAKARINKVVDQVVMHFKFLETPNNPTHPVKAGTTEVDALFIEIYCNPISRKEFNMFENPPSFVCQANYYRNESVPRLRHGGIPFPIWDKYKKNALDNVEYAWNPNYAKKVT